jgi:hypothetical protein
LPKPHQPTLQPKLCQRACKANAEEKEILKKMPHRTTKDNEKRNNK